MKISKMRLLVYCFLL